MRSACSLIQFTAPDFICSGIAPFGTDLAVLCHVLPDDDDDGAEDELSRPELRVLTWKNEELSCDALTLGGYEGCSPNDYRLDYIASEGLFYVISPQDVIVAKPRDADDHIQWLLEQHRHRDALEAAEISAAKKELRRHRVVDVGNAYLNELVQHGDFGMAARQCQRLLGHDAELWKRWVFVFGKYEQLAIIAPFMPVQQPQVCPALSPTRGTGSPRLSWC